ncbi:hypothetical protein [Flavobacterium oreochromis]|uniref:Transposase n=1 Tax=Flavobacterium columnare TaxID=996 RepID=A0A246GAB8_9FLAO|nr:hypothetical protein [Flavobacterium oreochromis]OWP76862.1 hypothetical protein BWK62_08725 [Flavobacterium oreochromis]
MAYNRKNFLKKVLKVQEIALHYSKQGLFFKEIYHLHIENQFNICKRTYDGYLGINARKELRELQEKQNNDQLTLF